MAPSVAVVLALLAAVAPAGAEGEAARVEARRLLQEGGRHVQTREFASALAAFEAAYRAVPSPKIFFNFGIAYEGLRRNADALAAFRRFQAEAPTAPKELRGLADKHIADLRKRVVVIEVTSDTAGADVMIDGVVRGKTPLVAPLTLDAGPHRVLVQKANEGSPWTEDIEPAPGTFMSLWARLKPIEVIAPPPVLAAGPDENVMSKRLVGEFDPPGSTTGHGWLWAGIGALLIGGAAAAYVLTRSPQDPVRGNFDPGVVTLR